MAPWITDLDALPLPDFTLADGTADCVIGRRKTVMVQTSRGCPFDCSFCSVTGMFGKKLFAALNVLDGTVIGSCFERHRHEEFLKFLRQVDRDTPEGLDLHLIVDNYSTHKHPKVKQWIQRHKRFHLHFIPTSSSWLNLVERWFGEITRKRIRRGIFKSVKELIEAIDDYVKTNNQKPKPFVWTKRVDEILEKVNHCKASTVTAH